MTLDPIIRGLGARLSGKNRWMAKCPAHDDRVPSLSIAEKDGKILVKCFGGCEQRDIIEALKTRDLWESEKRNPPPQIVATYDYTNEAGRLLYQVVRFAPKAFKQRRPNSCGGGWIWKKGPRQVLYRLPEVLEAPIVFVVEGEKDAETLRSRGFVATTNSGGAKAPWLPEFTSTLAGREVILIPHNDPPGRERVLTIARALLGKAARIIVVELEGVKDVTDWFQAGHGELELIAEVEGQQVSR